MAIKNEYILNFKSKGVNKTKNEVDKLNDSENKLEKSSLKLKAGIAVAGVAIVAIGKHAISTASQFESLKVRLTSMYGSVNVATKAFQTFQRVAATTPFAVKSVVEVGAQLKAFGLDAEKNIKGVADLAAFMGVDVVEAANSMGRAFAGGAGAADVLRERGILTLIRDFKGIDDLSKLTLPEFRKAMIETIEDPTAGIAGATTLLSETFEGSYSNMMDSVDRLSASIGDKLLPIAKSFTNGITDMINGIIGTEDATKSQIKSLKNEENAIRIATNAIINMNIPQLERVKKIRELQKEYPDFLKNINAETISNEELKKSLLDLNTQTQSKIDFLLQEKLLNETLKEQDTLITDVTESYTKAQNFAINFGQNATKAFGELKGASSRDFQSIIGDNQGFADSINESGRFATNFQGTVTHIAEKASELFKEYESGNLTMDEYTDKIRDLSENKAYQNMLGGDLKVTKDIIEQQDIFTTANENLNVALEDNAQKLENIKNKMTEIKEGEPITREDIIPTGEQGFENLREIFINTFGDPEVHNNLTNFTDGIEKINLGLRELPNATGEATSHFKKLVLNFQKGLKAVANDENEVLNKTMDAAGNIGMAMADNRAEQLKVQKFMIAGNIAKGIIDIWSEAAGKGPAGAALAAVETAGLVARGITQTKNVDKQIAGIKATKGSIGGTQTRFAQYGMNEVVDQATPIVAGEAGAELVQITPLEGANVDGPQGGGNIVITGNVLSRDFVQGELIDELREAIRQGYDFR